MDNDDDDDGGGGGEKVKGHGWPCMDNRTCTCRINGCERLGSANHSQPIARRVAVHAPAGRKLSTTHSFPAYSLPPQTHTTKVWTRTSSHQADTKRYSQPIQHGRKNRVRDVAVALLATSLGVDLHHSRLLRRLVRPLQSDCARLPEPRCEREQARKVAVRQSRCRRPAGHSAPIRRLRVRTVPCRTRNDFALG